MRVKKGKSMRRGKKSKASSRTCRNVQQALARAGLVLMGGIPTSQRGKGFALRTTKNKLAKGKRSVPGNLAESNIGPRAR